MKKTIRLSLLLFVICISNVFSQSKEDWKTFKNETYSIQYPEKWILDTSKQGIEFFLTKEKISNKMISNVNLLIQNLAGQNIDLEKYIEITEGQVTTYIPEGKMITNQKRTKGNHESYELVYSGNMQGNQVVIKQYIWLVKEKAYVLTFTAKQKKFEADNILATQILNTFTLH